MCNIAAGTYQYKNKIRVAGLIRPKMPSCLSKPLTAQPAIQPLTFLFWPIWQRKTKWKQYSIAGWTLSSKTLVYISQDTYSRKCRSQRVHAVVVLDLPRAGVRWLAKWEVREWSMSRQCGTGHWPAGYPTITEKASTRTFSWLKVPTSVFTFKNLLTHYAKWTLFHCE